jgi:hypothetical protein
MRVKRHSVPLDLEANPWLPQICIILHLSSTTWGLQTLPMGAIHKIQQRVTGLHHPKGTATGHLPTKSKSVQRVQGEG